MTQEQRPFREKYVTAQCLLLKPYKGNALNVITTLGQDEFLSSKAKALSNQVYNRTLIEVAGGRVRTYPPAISTSNEKLVIHPCVYASKRVPLHPTDGLELEYVEKWCKMLNFLAEKDLWKFGCMTALGFVELADPILDVGRRDGDDKRELAGNHPRFREQGVLFSFIFTDHTFEDVDKLNTLLNESIKWPKTFNSEGELGYDNWNEYPEQLYTPLTKEEQK